MLQASCLSVSAHDITPAAFEAVVVADIIQRILQVYVCVCVCVYVCVCVCVHVLQCSILNDTSLLPHLYTPSTYVYRPSHCNGRAK